MTAAPILTGDPALQPLALRINKLCDEQEFRCSFAIDNLISGERIGRDADRVTASASTRKILFMAAALAAAHAGRIDLDEEVELLEELTEGPVSGLLYFLTPGLRFPLRDAIVLMIIMSDNVCTSLVGDRVGLAAINDYAQRLGMSGTLIREIVPPRHMPDDADFDFVGQTTASDQNLLLRAILSGSTNPKAAEAIGLTAELCAYALRVLGWQRYRNRIPALLPTNCHVANKTGTGRQGAMDAGIVYRDSVPFFAISAFTTDVSPALSDGAAGHAAADLLIARIARLVWDHFSHDHRS